MQLLAHSNHGVLQFLWEKSKHIRFLGKDLEQNNLKPIVSPVKLSQFYGNQLLILIYRWSYQLLFSLLCWMHGAPKSWWKVSYIYCWNLWKASNIVQIRTKQFSDSSSLLRQRKIETVKYFKSKKSNPQITLQSTVNYT